MSTPANTPTADSLDFSLGFESAAQRIASERGERLLSAKKQLPFGNAFLDDCLRSIMPNDLIVIGARTGVGKTELARSIAAHNARQGNNVYYFALEAERSEIERRTKYGVLARLIFEHGIRTDRPFNYPDWYRGKFDFPDLELEADAFVAEQYKTLHTYYRGSRFGADDIRRLVLAHQHADLVVLDHLHYVDIDDDNEHRGMRELVMTIRDTALLAGLPVILVVHLRKKETSGTRSKALVPSMDDIHGSSEIAKICTHAIMLEPAYDVPARRNTGNTFLAIQKDRGDGAKHLIACCPFDFRRKSYVDEYTLGKEDAKHNFEPLDRDRVPFWAARHQPLSAPMEAL